MADAKGLVCGKRRSHPGETAIDRAISAFLEMAAVTPNDPLVETHRAAPGRKIEPKPMQMGEHTL